MKEGMKVDEGLDLLIVEEFGNVILFVEVEVLVDDPCRVSSIRVQLVQISRFDDLFDFFLQTVEIVVELIVESVSPLLQQLCCSILSFLSVLANPHLRSRSREER